VADLHDDLAAALAGRYEVERELGHGGMAVVYLARELKLGRQVAIKVLPPELATALAAERFVREIGIAARLTHPNILTVFDSVATDGILCFVMPYVDGETVAARMRRERQLPIDEAVSIARQVAAALDFAHRHGVVHRDIKPDNVLLVGEQALVADFGLARAIHTASSVPLTQSGLAVGTPSYMSPEQAAADHDVDGRSDIYSLGCMLFEMIAGVPPFRGANAQAVLAQHAVRVAPSVCDHRPSCPESVDRAIRRAMAKVPADRFRTAEEFARALVADPTPQRRPGGPAIPRRWATAADNEPHRQAAKSRERRHIRVSFSPGKQPAASGDG
jgi:serine/threonine-protein kinase